MNEELKTWLKSKISLAIKNEKEEIRIGNNTLRHLWSEDQKVHQAVLDKVNELEEAEK